MPCNCKENLWKIGPYVDGELPEAERQSLESSLRDCPDCRQLVEVFRRLDGVAAADRPPPVSGHDWARILDGVTREKKIATLPPRRRGRDWLVPLAAAAALVVLALFLGRGLFDPGPSTDIANGAGRAWRRRAARRRAGRRRGGSGHRPR